MDHVSEGSEDLNKSVDSEKLEEGESFKKLWNKIKKKSTTNEEKLKRCYSNWDNVKVLEWLAVLEIPDLKHIFKSNDITGHDLVDITDEELQALNITNAEHRKTILKSIKQLQAFESSLREEEELETSETDTHSTNSEDVDTDSADNPLSKFIELTKKTSSDSLSFTDSSCSLDFAKLKEPQPAPEEDIINEDDATNANHSPKLPKELTDRPSISKSEEFVIKCFYNGKVRLFRVKHGTTLSEFKLLLKTEYKDVKIHLKYKIDETPTAKVHSIKTQEAWQLFLDKAGSILNNTISQTLLYKLYLNE